MVETRFARAALIRAAFVRLRASGVVVSELATHRSRLD
jgi:hypothetical protein